MVEITATEPEQIFARTMANRAITRRVALKSRRRKLKTTMPVILTVTMISETTSFHGDFEERNSNGWYLDLWQRSVWALLQVT
jgi:hypothetical protein